jgi:hypothetical protein
LTTFAAAGLGFGGDFLWAGVRNGFLCFAI